MSIVIITLTDTEAGQVRIDASPPIPQLSAKHKDRATTPAEGYAMIALGSIMKTSLKEAQDKMKEKRKRESQILYPDAPRYKWQ